MDNKRFKRLFIIHLVLILILIGLIFKIELQEKNYNCSDCQISFINRIGYNEEEMIESFIYENITRMYEYYMKNDCSVRWIDNSYSGELLNISVNENG